MAPSHVEVRAQRVGQLPRSEFSSLHPRRSEFGRLATRPISMISGCCLLVPGLASLKVQSAGPTQGFAAFGATKQISIPILTTLLSITWVLCGAAKNRGGKARLLTAAELLLLMTMAGAVTSVVFKSAPGAVPVVQDALLFGLWFLAVAVGFSISRRYVDTNHFVADVRGAISVVLLLSLTLRCLGASGITSVPGSAAAVAALLTWREGSWLIRVSAVAQLALTLFTPGDGHTGVTGHNPSSALAAQVVCGFACCILYLVGRMSKTSQLIIGMLVVPLALFMLISSDAGALMLGKYSGPDITLQQRQYETEAAQQRVADHGDSARVVGLGLGSTVSLAGSPDARTLYYSGRELLHVRALHMLPAYLFLKFGLIGLVWLALICSAIVGQLLRSRKNKYAMTLTMFGVLALANAFPAATNLFADPLPWVLCAAGSVLLHRDRYDAKVPTAHSRASYGSSSRRCE